MLQKFDGHKENIRHLIDGGTVQQGWVPGQRQRAASWVEGGWSSSYYRSTGLIPARWGSIQQRAAGRLHYPMNETVPEERQPGGIGGSVRMTPRLKKDAAGVAGGQPGGQDWMRGECSADLKAGLMVEEDRERQDAAGTLSGAAAIRCGRRWGRRCSSYDEPQIRAGDRACWRT